MANNEPDYRSVSGAAETAEPTGNAAYPVPALSSSSSSTATQRRTPSTHRQPSSSSSSSGTPTPQLRKQASNSLLPHSHSPLSGASPRTSRNTSPIRKDSRPGPVVNSSFSGQPSAAAIQRALSASNVPQIPGSGSSSGGVTEAVSKLPGRGGARSTGAGGSGDSTPQWPTSPRLKSPPPSVANSRRGSAVNGKKTESSSLSAVAPAPTPTPPSISVQGATPTTSGSAQPSSGKQAAAEPAKSEQMSLQTPPVKMPSRGPSGKSQLETVQENSSDPITEPSPSAVQAAADLKPLTKLIEEDRTTPKRNGAEDGEKHSRNVGESESESGGNRSDGARSRRTSVSQPSNIQQRPKNGPVKNSFMPLTTTKSRQPDGVRNMTVETETVQSIPTSAINAGDRSGGMRGENSGSIRLKPSNETIRPKKERKKPSQKARSINQGTGTFRSPLLLQRGSLDDLYGSTCVSSTMSESSVRGSPPQQQQQHPARTYSQHLRHAISSTFRRSPSYFRNRGMSSDRDIRKASSKADIFEARVANAVDEANSSDSEETFVYESNPPEPQRRQPRHHSRTPSVTSSHSTADQRSGIRNFNDIMDERRVAGKRSMKFSNNPFNEHESPTERQDGTARSHQPRHYGRWGRGGSHASMFDQDSPFTQASRLRNSATNLRHSRPNSPRSPQSVQHNRFSSGPALFGGRRNDSSFDFDGEGADDERTPLVGSVRTPRGSRHGQRIHSSGAPSIDEYYGVRRQSRCGRIGGCMLGFIVFLVVMICAVAFLVVSTGPMYEVKIDKIQNVLASEQELMLDLRVGAVNPNPLGITVMEMDVNVFAKSKHVGSGTNRTQPDPDTTRRRRRTIDSPGHDHGTDPMPDPPDNAEKDAQTMLLGRIFHFDTALQFEGSPIKRHPHYSVGELRLTRPGNKTEAGGSERWEEVLKHPFELIVRGVLRYELPIGSALQKAAVGASVLVHPEDGVDEAGNMRVEQPSHRDNWQWIDWTKYDPSRLAEDEEELDEKIVELI